jgi:hypothetical protein
MSEVVVRDRLLGRLLAVLPAVLIALCVRVLTLGNPPTAARVAAAGVVAVAAWSAYRILTAKVTVTPDSLHVRGVLYDADIPLRDLQSVTVHAAPWPVRLLVWGVLSPRSIHVRAGARVLRPLALLSHEDDDDIDEALRALMLRCGTRVVPAQRQPADDSLGV